MEQLGIEPIQLATQVFNFLVMVIVLTKFLYKPILKILAERRKKIQAGLEYAEKMQQEAAKNEKRRQEIINAAKEDARKIIEEGKKAGKKLEAEIIQKAHEEGSLLLEKGRRELAMERAEMERELRLQTVGIATTMVETVLGKVLGVKSQQAIINKKIRELAKLTK